MTYSKKDIKNIIDKDYLLGVLEQDGWETLELTIRNDYKADLAEEIFNLMKNENMK